MKKKIEVNVSKELVDSVMEARIAELEKAVNILTKKLADKEKKLQAIEGDKKLTEAQRKVMQKLADDMGEYLSNIPWKEQGGYMKVEINLEDHWGYDDASIAELLRDAIREEIKLAAKRIAKVAVKKLEVEAKKAVSKVLTELETEVLKKLETDK